MQFASKHGYIAGVSNPLFKSQKNTCDIICDMENGLIFESDSQLKLFSDKEINNEKRIQNIEHDFIV